MENRQSHVLVGAIAVALLVALFAFTLWLGRLTGEPKKEYDIFFKQSVSGLATGSPVLFGGVPVGQVKRIALMPESPEFVRVRINVDETVPILQGTSAAIEGVGFTGVSQIALSGAMRGAEPIVDEGPYGVPVIPTKASGFGELLASAPQLLERVSVLTERISLLLDDRNRNSLANILKNIDSLTGSMADEKGDFRASLAQLRTTLASANRAAEEIAQVSASANTLLTQDGKPLVADLRSTLARANTSMEKIDSLLAAAEPGVKGFSESTLPEVDRLVRDLRQVSQSLGAFAAKLDEDPAGALVGGRTLPDYTPQGDK
ncbi:MlaD family protein [Sandaracinobacteroides saxicola]|uniref:MCE family protein n=1 Tax=Sandaracinobacteroides saxicola TaxID=2759707 RepID=A0A7G5IIE4_9SPHN|nr:MlaD family protein [Sandaracinobacteroides saxicola]QMW23136.1 MCE family protein [Sandaracinobacteroides saxicola]